jgi:hypothetical protein
MNENINSIELDEFLKHVVEVELRWWLTVQLLSK